MSHWPIPSRRRWRITVRRAISSPRSGPPTPMMNAHTQSLRATNAFSPPKTPAHAEPARTHTQTATGLRWAKRTHTASFSAGDRLHHTVTGSPS